MSEIVFQASNKALTTSRLIANVFGKEHSKVIRSIENILANQATFGSVNFEKSTYLDSKGEERPMYIMNRDGFTLLVMGFNGKKALQFKLDFINAFNQMEQHIKREQSQLQQPMSMAQVLLQSAQALVDIENKMKLNDQRTSLLEQKVDAIVKERSLIQDEYKELTLPLVQPVLSDRDYIRKMVNDYCAYTRINQQEVWHDVYASLYYKYNKSINSYKRISTDKSKLDVAERNGLLPYIKDIVIAKVYPVLKKSEIC